MKNFLYIILILSLTSCSSISVPNYIQDKHPYVRTFYAEFDTVHAATTEALENNGWFIKKESDPALFEREREYDDGRRQTLLFTKVRDTSFFVGSGNVRLNAYLRETAESETMVEIRYLKVTPAMVKNFYGYRNDQMIDRIFENIEKALAVFTVD